MGLFQGLFQGKANRPDFTPDMLPKNRFELFFEMLKLNLFNLVKVNAFYLLFTIPMWIWIYMNFRLLMNMVTTAADSDALMQQLSQFFTQGQYTVVQLGFVPCIFVLGPG